MMRHAPLLLAALLLAAAPAALATQTSERATVRAVPSATSTTPGAIIRVAVKIQDARDAGSVPFTLLYDPSVLEFLPSASSEGDFMRRDGSKTSFLAVQSSRKGTISGIVVGLSRLRSDKGASGRGTLCHLVFRARAEGLASLSFGQAAILDPKAGRLASEFQSGSILVRRPR